MNADSTPRAIVLAGINGAGKTTSSRSLLAEELSLMTFVNADVIAQGLSGFDPDSAAIEASRVMLEHLHALAAKRADFALETTLAARTYVSWLKTLRESGYDVRLVYFWLKSADLAVSRVAARVRAGGHNIPESTIRRRYGKRVHNLLALYIPIVSKWSVYDNSGDEPRPIANGSHGRIDRISDPDTWARLTRAQTHE